jgi:5'-nucleotidase
VSKTAIETHTGLLFDYADPQPHQVCLEDIAHALSLSCRFGGHVSHFYSVAQHALLVCDLVGLANPLHPRLPELQLAALHHDSHEAYIGDIPTPMKRALHGCLGTLVAKVDRAIRVSQDIDRELLYSEPIRAADHLALRIEATKLKVNNGRSFAEAAGTLPAAAEDVWRPHFNPNSIKYAFTSTDADLREEIDT